MSDQEERESIDQIDDDEDDQEARYVDEAKQDASTIKKLLFKKPEKRQVDVSRAGNRVWLVKLPDFLADTWLHAAPESDLGTLTIGAPTEGSSVPKVSLEIRRDLELIDEAILEIPTGQLPTNYDLKFTSNPDGNVLIFSTHTEIADNVGEVNTMRGWRYNDEIEYAIGIEGTVQHECNVVPVMDETYRNVMRLRRAAAEKPKRITQQIDSSTQISGNKKTASQPMTDSYLLTAQMPFGSAATMFRDAKKRKMEMLEQRKEKLPRNEALNLIFKAFEDNDYWSVSGMVEQVQQPLSYVRELLSEVGSYITRGPYKNLYQLKPEFKGDQQN